jgi:hypothetical protein
MNQYFYAFVLGVVASLHWPATCAAEPVEMGSRRELFVDRHWLDGARLELHHPRRAGVALTMDRLWELSE